MSYLMKFERKADKVRVKAVNQVFSLQWRSVKGQVEVNTHTPQDVYIFYKQYSRLAYLIRHNHEQECYFIAQAVRKALDLPPSTTFQFMSN